MPALAPVVGPGRLLLLESEAEALPAYGQGHPEEDGAVCEGRGYQSKLPQLTSHVRLEPPGRGCRGGLHQRTPGSFVYRIKRTLCAAVESARQRGILANDPESDQ